MARYRTTGRLDDQVLQDGDRGFRGIDSYQEATKWSGFCGGMTNDVIWYEKSLYLDICDSHGFIIEIFKEEPNHPHGPAICFRALKR